MEQLTLEALADTALKAAIGALVGGAVRAALARLRRRP